MHRTGRVKRSFVPITSPASKPLYEGSNNRALGGFDLVYILTRIQRYLIFRYSNVHVTTNKFSNTGYLGSSRQ